MTAPDTAPPSTEAAALTAKMMGIYKAQRDQLEIRSAALEDKLTAALAENEHLKASIAKLEGSPPAEPAKPGKPKKEA